MEALWNALDDPESGRVAAAYAGVMPYVIMFSVIAAILQTPSPPTIEGLISGGGALGVDVWGLRCTAS